MRSEADMKKEIVKNEYLGKSKGRGNLAAEMLVKKGVGFVMIHDSFQGKGP